MMKSLKAYVSEQSITGGFNIARIQMPQIDDIENFLEYLSGIEGGYFQRGEFSVEGIKPLQTDFDQSKVDAIKNFEKPIIVSQDNFILDGHHRFFASVAAGNKYINMIKVDLTINKLLKVTMAYLDEKRS
jgi:hypothetical protein